MILRMKYAKPWLPREEAEVTGRWNWPRGSKYIPHQGAKEKKRRVKQMTKSANATFMYRV